MPRTGITAEEVANAIATIQGRQKNPTVDSIREELGTGSRTTISKYFSEWKTKNGVKNTTDTGIPNELQNLIQSLWEKIQSDADNKIEQHQIETNEEIGLIKNQLAQTQCQNELLHNEIAELTEKLKIQINTSTELTIKLHGCENEKIKSDARVASLETQNNNQKSENERLHQLLKNTQDNLIHYHQAVEKQRVEQHMQLEKERAEYVSKINIIEKQFRKTLEEKSVTETKYALLSDEFQIQKSKLTMIEEEKSRLQLKNNELIIKTDHLNQQNEKSQHELSIIKNLLKENENVLSDTKIQMGILNNENNTLSKKHEFLEDKINGLQSNINILLQENSILKQAIKETSV